MLLDTCKDKLIEADLNTDYDGRWVGVLSTKDDWQILSKLIVFLTDTQNEIKSHGEVKMPKYLNHVPEKGWPYILAALENLVAKSTSSDINCDNLNFSSYEKAFMLH